MLQIVERRRKMYQAKVILDSVATNGARLITMELLYPFIVHYDALTHRGLGKSDEDQYQQWLEFSRNSASNRGMPTNIVLDTIINSPFIPRFRYNTSTMFPGEYFSDEDQSEAEKIWLRMLDNIIQGYHELTALGAHKQWKNKLFVPWQHITTVITANDEMWYHFFSLRNHENAQDELHTIAALAQTTLEQRNIAKQRLHIGEWHLPYVIFNSEFKDLDLETKKRISVAKCANTSFMRQNEDRDVQYYLEIYNRLLYSIPPHGSPFEHVAQVAEANYVRSGNFVGFYQYRKTLGI